MKATRTQVERPTKISLPSIKKDSNLRESSPFFRRLSQDDLVSPNSNDRVKTWLFIQPETKQNVEFDPSSEPRRLVRTHSTSIFDITDSLPDIDLSKTTDTNASPHHVSLTAARFQRTGSPRTMSLSSTKSSSTNRSTRHESFVHHPSSVRFRTQSIDIAESTSRSSITKERPTIYPFLIFNSLLTASDRQKIEEIRQQLPEEFEEYLPTLFRLGIVHLPQKFFENRFDFTGKELKQRQRLMTILDKDHENEEHQRRLHRLFRIHSFRTNSFSSSNLLRENLSHQGQLSLLAAYRDQIENELNKKIRFWKSIPMKSIQMIHQEDRSFVQSISPRLPPPTTIKRTFNQIVRTHRDEILSLSMSEKLDQQWKRKFIGKIIEQGMKILDQVTNIPPTRNSSSDQQFNDEELIRTFKRWIFIWFTLFNDDQ